MPNDDHDAEDVVNVVLLVVAREEERGGLNRAKRQGSGQLRNLPAQI